MGNGNAARQRSAAAARGRRRRREGQPAHPLAPRTPIGNLWVSVANKFGSPIDTLGESTGRVDLFAYEP